MFEEFCHTPALITTCIENEHLEKHLHLGKLHLVPTETPFLEVAKSTRVFKDSSGSGSITMEPNISHPFQNCHLKGLFASNDITSNSSRAPPFSIILQRVPYLTMHPLRVFLGKEKTGSCLFPDVKFP